MAWPPNTPAERIKGLEMYLSKQAGALGKIASAGGVPESSYASESGFYEERWQDVWYGPEVYPYVTRCKRSKVVYHCSKYGLCSSLLEAKKEWDPLGVFSGHKVVGSEIFGS